MVFRRSRDEALKKADNLFQMTKRRTILEEEFK
jgi:hypothetical protein